MLIQIAVLDIVFSLDSVITAVGLVEHVTLMAIAIILAVLVMLVRRQIDRRFCRSTSDDQDSCAFVPDIGRPPLILEGFGIHIPKGYIYFAMAFSISVEFVNLRMRKKAADAVKLQGRTRASLTECQAAIPAFSAFWASSTIPHVPPVHLSIALPIQRH